MTNKKLFITLFVLILIVIALSWYLTISKESQELPVRSLEPIGTIVNNEACQRDIVFATSESEGKICTQQIERLSCVHDSAVEHDASGGCVISELKNLGWTSVSTSID